MKYLILLFMFFAILQTAKAQTTFSKIISNYPLDPENSWTVKEIADGFIVGSWGECLGQDIINCGVLSKLNQNGEVLWFKQYNFYPHAFTSLAVRGDKIYLSGSTNQGDVQLVLYCLDLEGNIIWYKEYGLPDRFEGAPTFAFTSDNYILLCGTRTPDTVGMPENVVYLVKTDLDGNKIDEYTYGFQNGKSLGRSIIETTDMQTIFSYRACPVLCSLEFTAGVASVGASGNLNWNLKFPFAYQPDRPNAIQTGPETLVVNWHHETTLPNHDLEPPALFYLNLEGQVQDSLIFENQTLKAIDDLEAVWEKGLVGCGNYFIDYITEPNPDPAGWVFRVDEHKAILWERSYTDTTQQGRVYTLQSIEPTSDGGYIAVGTLINNMTGVLESHNWVLKLDSLGCLQPGCGEINYITGIEEAVFLKGKDILFYPNPSNGYLNVKFPSDFALGKDVLLDLVSASGGFIKRVKISSLDARIDLSALLPGFYFAIISQGNEIIASKKIMVGR